MRKQKIFFTFLLFSGAIVAAIFSIQSAEAVYNFLTLKEKARGQALRWEIRELNERFPLTCIYFFEFNGASWKGSTVLAKPWHLNEFAATLALKEKAKEDLIVWFNPKNPNKSSIEKNFPSGLLFRTLCSYGIFVYFLVFFRKIYPFVRSTT